VRNSNLPILNKTGNIDIYHTIDQDNFKQVQYVGMLSISHALTGAFIASKLTHPALYLPLTLAAHYFEDWVPHWDVGTGLSTGKRKKSTAIILEFAELGVTLGLLALFCYDKPQELWLHIGLAAFTGLVPDFLEAPRNFLKWEPFFLKPFNDFHNLFHHSTPNMMLGLLPQVILVVGVFLLG